MWPKLKTKKVYIPAIILVVIILIAGCIVYKLINKPIVAVIPITGEIISSPRYNDDGSIEKGDAIAIDIISQIRKDNKDKRVKAIVFVIDSPGGDPESAEEIISALKETKKPTVSLIRSIGDSSAYWIASATNRIFALPLSDTTDMGVTMSYLDNITKNKNDGLTFNSLSVGKYKDMGNPDAPLTAEEKIMFMEQLTEMDNVFIQSVAENRHLPLEKVQALADGSSILAQDAIKDGLIDQLGSFADVDTYLSKLLHMNVSIKIPTEEI